MGERWPEFTIQAIMETIPFSWTMEYAKQLKRIRLRELNEKRKEIALMGYAFAASQSKDGAKFLENLTQESTGENTASNKNMFKSSQDDTFVKVVGKLK